MKIIILNDTSKGYAGSVAAMNSIFYELRNYEIIEKVPCGKDIDREYIHKADAVIANGEGTIHHNSKTGNNLMEALRCAQKFNKKTYLINALFQQKTPYYKDVLRNLTFLSVREPLSAKCARENDGKPKIFADSCLGVVKHFTRKFIEINNIAIGTVRPDSGYDHIVENFTFPRVHVPHHSMGNFNQLIHTLKTCKVYITGQHHGIYAAGIAGVPFLPIPSNSHKIEGILLWFKQTTGLDIPISKSENDLIENIHWAKNNKSVFKEFQKFLLTREIFKCPLKF